MFLRTTRHVLHQSRRNLLLLQPRHPPVFRGVFRPRSMAGATSAAVDEQPHHQQDMIRATIQKLFAEQCGEGPSASICNSAEAIQQAVQRLQNQVEEARCCILDAKDAKEGPEFEEEVQTAELAMERAVAALVDLLDAMREGVPAADSTSATTPPLPQVAILRQEHTALIKALRQELHQLRNKGQQ